MKPFATLFPLLLLAGCAGVQNPREPSLAPRAAEAIDPRVPVPDTSGQLPASAELRGIVQALLAQARGGTSAFARAADAAERAVAGAGARGSESWVAAQQLLSAAVAARYPASRALGDIDEIAARAVQDRGGLVRADIATVQTAATEIAAIDRAQAARIDSLQAQLAR